MPDRVTKSAMAAQRINDGELRGVPRLVKNVLDIDSPLDCPQPGGKVVPRGEKEPPPVERFHVRSVSLADFFSPSRSAEQLLAVLEIDIVAAAFTYFERVRDLSAHKVIH